MSHPASSIRYRASFILLGLGVLLLMGGGATCFAEPSPLDLLRDQEQRHKDQKGEVYLGKVMTLDYAADSVEPGKECHPLLLELTDLLKTPIRQNYRLVLKGYSGPGEIKGPESRRSRERAERLKTVLVKTYGLEESRIFAEGLGNTNAVTSDETQEGRSLNRRVEIHVYGNVSEAVRFMKSEAGK